MNKVQIIGRMTKDPEVKLTQNQTPFCNFTVAVDRRFKDSNGQRQADFINCVAWHKTAQFIQKYFKKGSRVGIVGSIQTRTFEDQNGQKRYITEVLVEEAEFVDSGNKEETKPAEQESDAGPEIQNDAGPADGGVDLPFEI